MQSAENLHRPARGKGNVDGQDTGMTWRCPKRDEQSPLPALGSCPHFLNAAHNVILWKSD